MGLRQQRLAPQDWEDVRPQRERQRGSGSSQTLSVFLFLEEVYRDPLLLLPGVGFLSCFIAKRAAAGVDGAQTRRLCGRSAGPRARRSVSAKTAFQRVPARPRSARQARRQHPESRGGITPTALAGCVLRFSLGLPPSSTCALRIEGNDRPETRCRTEGIDSRPVFLPEFLQPARLALSFSATSIR